MSCGDDVVPPSPLHSSHRAADETKRLILQDDEGNNPCEGYVKVYNENVWGYVGDKFWSRNTERVVCRSANCGEPVENSTEDVFQLTTNMIWLNEVNCSGSEKNIWDCQYPCWNCSFYQKLTVKKIKCSHKIKLSLDGFKCAGAVQYSTNGETPSGYFCADNWDTIEVVLLDKSMNPNCHGKVYIKVNNSNPTPVCASYWSHKNAEMVCRELKCGSVVESYKDETEPRNGMIDYVNCTGSESSLWHCKAKRDLQVFQCQSNVKVVCSESIKTRLTNSPGKCAGKLEIMHEGQWKNIYKTEWSEQNSNIVCNRLKCGNVREYTGSKSLTRLDAFLKKTVNCPASASDISECSLANLQSGKSPDQEAVEITCEEHKMIFLDNTSCSGSVVIKQGSNTYWLSGSTETWNTVSAEVVCQQMHCGNATSFSYIPSADMRNAVSEKSYNCSSNSTNLFDCENDNLPSDHNAFIATVNCSGDIKITLTNNCWGHVNVCMDKNCGGVCANTWTENKSTKLCEELTCGSNSVTLSNQDNSNNVLINSVHTLNERDNLKNCTIVKDDGACKSAAFVICSGSIKPKLQISRDKCSGNVELLYKDQWLPVCKDALKDKEQNIICKELGCGEAGNSIDYFGPKSTKKNFISNIECPENATSLAGCKIPVTSSSCTLGGLQCSDWKKIALTDGCRGIVYVQSSKEYFATVSAEGFSEIEGNRLCQDLDCGKFKLKMEKKEMSISSAFNCTGVKDPNNIWDCETPPTSKKMKHLYIECEESKVHLSEQCKGEVMINGVEVCSSQWKDSYSNIVCQEYNCSNAILSTVSNKQPRADQKYHHISCENHHNKLANCKRFTETCSGKLVYVYCVGNINFNTTEKCGGYIEIKYQGRWEKVCPSNNNNNYEDMLCKEIGCIKQKSIKKNQKKTKPLKVNVETSLDCSKGKKDIRYCVLPMSCKNNNPAEIYCEGYVGKEPEQKDTNKNPLSIILGVVFSLVLVILIVVFVRIRIARKAKDAKNMASRMFSRKDVVEFESGEYADVSSRTNEMDDFSRGRFRSEAGFFTEHEARSTSSFPYDDIDEVEEALPLTAQAYAAGASGGGDIPESAFDQNGVTYEVDDPLENYDDIEADPVITQTQAEVHSDPKNTPEGNAGAPPGLVQDAEDYLEPGQDG
ncbi:hypothetical protein PAMP_011619 [Pampus punctatissimus]